MQRGSHNAPSYTGLGLIIFILIYNPVTLELGSPPTPKDTSNAPVDLVVWK